MSPTTTSPIVYGRPTRRATTAIDAGDDKQHDELLLDAAPCDRPTSASVIAPPVAGPA